MNIIDKFLPIGKIIRDFPYTMVFKTTNYCWYNCHHCCESANAKQPKNFISNQIIENYLYQAISDPLFSGNVVFTGGEIMASYLFENADYVPYLLDKSLKMGLNVDIKTNAGWVKSNFCNKIFYDLNSVIAKHPDNELSVSLSLDKYHKNCFDNNYTVIKQFANQNNHIQFHVSGFKETEYLFTELMNKLAKSGIKTSTAYTIDTDDNLTESFYILNDNVKIYYTNGTLFSGGRAKNIKNARRNNFPEFSFLSPDCEVLMAFDSFGRVTLGENNGKKISANWQAPFNRIWNLNYIRNKLIINAQLTEIYAKAFKNWHFNR
ncbi:MAG: radical SAM protein [Alphaproteobacteria bacterium]|nr:radical SAM protein [Alphaproteobacteria bacterium]